MDFFELSSKYKQKWKTERFLVNKILPVAHDANLLVHCSFLQVVDQAERNSSKMILKTSVNDGDFHEYDGQHNSLRNNRQIL